MGRKTKTGAATTTRRRGRPLKLTPETHAKLVQYVGEGAYLAHAAAALRLRRETVGEWVKRGRLDASNEEDTIFSRLYFDLEAGKARAAMIAQRRILEAGDRDWRAGAWYLERVHPEHFGPPRESGPRAGHALDLKTLADDDTIEALSDGELELLDRSLANATRILERAKARTGAPVDDVA